VAPRTRIAEERGSVLPVLAVGLGAVGLSLALLALLAAQGVRVARAQWVADAAALAAASTMVDGDRPVPPGGSVGAGGEAADPGGLVRRAGAAVAAANGGRLVSLELLMAPRDAAPGGLASGGPDVETGLIPASPMVVVEVERGGIRARAAARGYAVETGRGWSGEVTQRPGS